MYVLLLLDMQGKNIKKKIEINCVMFTRYIYLRYLLSITAAYYPQKIISTSRINQGTCIHVEISFVWVISGKPPTPPHLMNCLNLSTIALCYVFFATKHYYVVIVFNPMLFAPLCNSCVFTVDNALHAEQILLYSCAHSICYNLSDKKIHESCNERNYYLNNYWYGEY